MFDEDSRVKIPTVLHMVRLGYEYISKKKRKWDPNTNIFTDIFYEEIKRINPNSNHNEIKNLYDKVFSTLKNNDLGEEFYNKLKSESGIKLIDFENPENNKFNVLTELTYKKDDDEFRPDITVLVNGMPLAFIEVKKPNNKNGILSEQNRMQDRFKNKNYSNFINITQLIVFSNNMEYDDDSHLPLEGAYYLTTSYKKSDLNYFREENKEFENPEFLNIIDDDTENFILKDNNKESIKKTPEFLTNKDPNRPTNRICTSLFYKKRFLFLLKYGIAYVKKENLVEKHIMRYPQFFASQEIRNKISEGKKKGVIWHTQGSGKTALAYYNTKILLDYFRSKEIVAKFYFIVDRIDLLDQASSEFRSRGLSVHNINSKEEFIKDINSLSAIHNDDGNDEITVINIQKFKNDQDVINKNDYNLKIQRVYFIDEVHRGYKTTGKFLLNLHESDFNSIKIGLTGTPLLGKDSNTKSLFGGYLHKYFYNQSISDGYTLRLIREEIENQQRNKLKKILDDISVSKSSINNRDLYAHKKFVEPMLEYIVEDFEKSRILHNDNTIGGMVICDSLDQAKTMYSVFSSKYENKKGEENIVNSSALILHNEGTKTERKALREEFKLGNIDLLFVNQMLLTGFDCPRLKKLYLGRKIEAHSLLQALTRVNRTYNNFRYGYVVDFADIEEEFEKTNQAYFNELELEFGNEIENYKSLFKNEKEIDEEINELKNILFKYDTSNIEVFSQQIDKLNEKKDLSKIVNSLQKIKELYNVIRFKGDYEVLKKIDLYKYSKLYHVASARLNFMNERDSSEIRNNVRGLLNLALANLDFTFVKIKEEELILADKYRTILIKIINCERNNFDPKDPNFVSLKTEIERIMKKKNIINISNSEKEERINELNKLYKKLISLENENDLLKRKYNNDKKYARIHKRLNEIKFMNLSEIKLYETLSDLKKDLDEEVLKNSNILENTNYVEKVMSNIIFNHFNNKNNFNFEIKDSYEINKLITKEYINENNGLN